MCTRVRVCVCGHISSLPPSPCSHATHQLESQRELLMKKLVEAEMDGTAMTKQVETLKRTLRKMERVSRVWVGGASKSSEVPIGRTSLVILWFTCALCDRVLITARVK